MKNFEIELVGKKIKQEEEEMKRSGKKYLSEKEALSNYKSALE